MRELIESEIESVDGAGVIYDAFAAGVAVAGWVNAAKEAMYNDPFRRQYRSI